ncbi:MAG: hypothetical protein JWQ21_823 [Herminiimonas sp.]|nr:hypothetical protein [Herminiimonas sp.]
MFDHDGFRKIQFEAIPLNQDLIMMDAKWIAEFEREWIKTFNESEADPYLVGYVSHISARSVGNDWIELSWYPNTHDRFHEVPVFLPKSAFVNCVDVWQYDGRPTVFVYSEWLTDLHERPLAAFAIVDAIGVKELLRTGRLRPELLHTLRDRIDMIADRYPDFAFISFADSLLVKQAWSVGHVHSSIGYTYTPELLLPVVSELFQAFEETLNVPAYGILTQGLNAYSDDVNLHCSGKGNHVSLNTLGLPFAQLMAIEDAARHSIRVKAHAPAELYLDSTFFRSLKMKFEFDKNRLPTHAYQSPLTKSPKATYVATSVREIMDNLKKRD